MKKLSLKKAFSPIELSIVILIIGILIAGVTQSSRLIRAAKLQTARTFTKSSPVSSVPDLVAWWETTLEESFGGVEPEEAPDGGASGVATWHDINPRSSVKNNAVSPSSDNNPGYTSQLNTINGLPTLKFDGVNHFFDFDGNIVVGSNYSIFIVEQRIGRDSSDHDFLIGAKNPYDCQSTNTADTQLLIGFSPQTRISWDQCLNEYKAVLPEDYYPILPRIHSMVFDSTASTWKTYYLNGVSQSLMDTYGRAHAGQITSYEGAAIGRDSTYHYNGNIGEIIIFDRALENEERQSIEEYLSKKWGIKIN